jgi:hypothetical protein
MEGRSDSRQVDDFWGLLISDEPGARGASEVIRTYDGAMMGAGPRMRKGCGRAVTLADLKATKPCPRCRSHYDRVLVRSHPLGGTARGRASPRRKPMRSHSSGCSYDLHTLPRSDTGKRQESLPMGLSSRSTVSSRRLAATFRPRRDHLARRAARHNGRQRGQTGTGIASKPGNIIATFQGSDGARGLTARPGSVIRRFDRLSRERRRAMRETG